MSSSRLRAAMDGEDGLSIVELVVALTVLTIIMTATASGVTSALGLSQDSRARTVAAGLATEEQELQRTLPFDQHVVGTAAPKTVTVAGVPYQVVVTKNWAAQNSTTGVCAIVGTGASANLAYMAVDVQVTWPDMGSTQPVRSATVIAPPNATYSPYAGHIVGKVVDRQTLPASGFRMDLANGPSTVPPQNTGADGCATFSFLRPGTYTVTVSDPSGAGRISSRFSGGQFVTAPSEQLTITPNGTRTMGPVQFALPGTLTWQLRGGYSPSRGIRPTSLPVTLRHDSLPTGVLTQTNLATFRAFPFPTPYEVYAGARDCLDHRTPRRDLSAAPGATVDGGDLLATLKVTVLNGTIPVANYPSRTWTATSRDCSGVSYSVTSGTDANGQAFLALPYGDYRIAVQGVPRTVDTSERLTQGNRTFDVTLQIGNSGSDEDDD